ncbi:MAG: DNA-3-methyladenine glycosylase 2 family protein, partial [Actinomycetota bacterium]|nr:DNA-3-methyladenine glycosylase 2 family protein [Actinomycetota bacterium]
MATRIMRTFRIEGALDLRRTLLPLQRGSGDPTMRVGEREVWRATRTPNGPATLHLALRAGSLAAEAWG